MALQKTIYNTFFRKNSMFIATIFASAFVAEAGYNLFTDRIWDNINKGKQWKDIKEKYNL